MMNDQTDSCSALDLPFPRYRLKLAMPGRTLFVHVTDLGECTQRVPESLARWI